MNNLFWNKLSADNHLHIPPDIRPWLIHTGSLTTRLRETCDNFSVKLIAQNQRAAQPHEIDLLDIIDAPLIIEREVLLFCGDTPVIYARSFIPLKALKDRFADLNTMGTQPLGEKIFADPELKRSNIEWTILTENHPSYPHAVSELQKAPDKIYGRRSLFFGAPSPILISEFFLPPLAMLQK
ncbi:MAG: Chorismate--pyruvate lyase [uncultured Thiotrichaceae bacterium]|uniref:Probable chorismate pyruvate-lyase n=1 Tax=uncultured Thiotrichaceae bacterium TaxID=298394 RepID=A0A6S6U406_9GAMM|nr:MAG: Chorismate--pyruvate lyase [uncultured Thiotrichaceae bacterium]